MCPCNLNKPQTPALFTYYVIMSLLVVALAVSLMWVPFVQMITEVNIIISKALIYTNKELLGDYNICWLNDLGAFFTSQQAILIIAVISLLYMLYLASGDFLVFAGCYVCNWPNHKRLQKIKRTALGVIDYLLNLTGKKKFVSFNGNVKVKFYDPSEPNKSDGNVNHLPIGFNN